MNRDIDDLISQFSGGGSTGFADMKRVWLTKKFSYIYNARPTCTNSLALFMQSLYSHSIRHLISSGSLSPRLGGLYCLYCLYETQPFKPPFKIYLSLEELKKLRQLAADAKLEGVTAAGAVVRRMLEKKVFLLGCVETNEGLKGKVDRLTELENARIRTACEKLFGDGRIEEFSQMDLGVEVDLGKVREISGEYVELKRVAAEEGGDEEMKGAEGGGGKELVGDVLGKIVKEWDEQRGVFYRETGLSQRMYEEKQQQEEEGEDDSFDKELELMLSEI